jgi:hypothetical protein
LQRIVVLPVLTGEKLNRNATLATDTSVRFAKCLNVLL